MVQKLLFNLPASRGFPSIFIPPPLDGAITFPELFAHNAVHNPDHPFFVYADESQVNHIGHRMVYLAQLKFARLVKSAYERSSRSRSGQDETPVFGILAVAGM